MRHRLPVHRQPIAYHLSVLAIHPQRRNDGDDQATEPNGPPPVAPQQQYWQKLGRADGTSIDYLRLGI
jgi:hypothetical protein